MTKSGGEQGHLFGGDWTERKLGMVADYLRAYTKALKGQAFRKLYVDAFAGSPYREARSGSTREAHEAPLFPELAAREPRALLEGSARKALATQPPFDGYLFIERDPSRCAELESLRYDFPHLAGAIEIRQGEANTELQALCSQDWSGTRAVLFLDPYGMQVDWATLEAIARTQAIDLWVLFPLGIAVNRMLPGSGVVPPGWRRRLDQLFGAEDWYEEFYRVEREPSLLDGVTERIVKEHPDKIAAYWHRRLRQLFPAVASRSAVLRNSRRSPLYLLSFAIGNPNPRAQEIALRIADHLLKEER